MATASSPVTAPPTTSGTARKQSSGTASSPCSRPNTSSLSGARKRASALLVDAVRGAHVQQALGVRQA